MARRTIQFIADNFYHVYNRGNNKQSIFFEQENYLYFLQQFRKYVSDSSVKTIAYCLIPNHYHFLLQVMSEGHLSRDMKNFLISYVKAINTRFGRVGTLFQGEFKAKVVDSDEYLVYLSRYIHTNPVFAHLVDCPADWEFSSMKDYLGLRPFSFVDCRPVLSHFRSSNDYEGYVQTFTEDERRKLYGGFF